MDWDEYAEGWDDDPAVRAYADAAFATLSRELRARDVELASLRVLDFGCGTGLLTEKLAGACTEVVGIDPAEKMIAVLRGKIDASGWKNVHTVVGTVGEDRIEEGPLAAPFDLVVCSSVCAFLPDYPATVRALVAQLAPQGVFAQFDWERDDASEDPFGLTRGEIEAALDQAGLARTTVDTAFEQPVGEMTMKPLLGLGRRPAA